jgi:hypothetical protein
MELIELITPLARAAKPGAAQMKPQVEKVLKPFKIPADFIMLIAYALAIAVLVMRHAEVADLDDREELIYLTMIKLQGGSINKPVARKDIIAELENSDKMHFSESTLMRSMRSLRDKRLATSTGRKWLPIHVEGRASDDISMKRAA